PSHREQGRWVRVDRGHSCPLIFFVSTDMRRTRMSAVQVRTPAPPPYAKPLPRQEEECLIVRRLRQLGAVRCIARAAATSAVASGEIWSMIGCSQFAIGI